MKISNMWVLFTNSSHHSIIQHSYIYVSSFLKQKIKYCHIKLWSYLQGFNVLNSYDYTLITTTIDSKTLMLWLWLWLWKPCFSVVCDSDADRFPLLSNFWTLEDPAKLMLMLCWKKKRWPTVLINLRHTHQLSHFSKEYFHTKQSS